MFDFIAAHWLDIVTTLLGLYILLEYRASIALWLVGIIMPAPRHRALLATRTVRRLRHGHLLHPRRHMRLSGVEIRAQTQSDRRCRHAHHTFQRRLILPSAIVFFVAWAVIYWILIRFTNSNIPVLDSFGNALSFIGLWALARKYLEQWIIWIVVDSVLAGLYIYKGIPFKASLYARYMWSSPWWDISKWLRMMKA